MCACKYGFPHRYPLELELQELVSYSAWVLETAFGPLESQVSILKTCAMLGSLSQALMSGMPEVHATEYLTTSDCVKLLLVSMLTCQPTVAVMQHVCVVCIQS